MVCDLHANLVRSNANRLSITAATLLYLIGLPLLVTYLIQLSPVLNSKWFALESVGHAM